MRCPRLLALATQGAVLDGETEEEALERRIDEGKIGKGKTLRRWMDTEEKVSCWVLGRSFSASMPLVRRNTWGE